MMWEHVFRFYMEKFGLALIPVNDAQKRIVDIPEYITLSPEHGDIIFNSFNEPAFVIVSKQMLPKKGQILKCKFDPTAERPQFSCCMEVDDEL